MLLEDLGDLDYGRLWQDGADMTGPYEAALDALLRLQSAPTPASVPLPDERRHIPPRYMPEVWHIEVELLTD